MSLTFIINIFMLYLVRFIFEYDPQKIVFNVGNKSIYFAYFCVLSLLFQEFIRIELI